MQFENRTIVEILRERAEKQPDQTAYIFLDETEHEEAKLTYADIDQNARKMAARLQAESDAGDRALLLYPTGAEFISAFFGCMYAGVIPIPTNPPRLNRSALRLSAIVNDSDAKLALTTPDFIEDLSQRFEQVPKLESLQWFDNSQFGEVSPNGWKQPDLTSESLAFIQYTSGSTSSPRGVTISHKNAVHNVMVMNESRVLERGPDSVFVNWAPIFHDMGLIGSIILTACDGFPSVLMSPIAFLQKPVRWLNVISRYHGTVSGGPNFSYELCINKIDPEDCKDLDLSSWRLAFNSAEPVRAETQDRFAEKFAPYGFRYESFHPCYGLAEATLLVTIYGGANKTLTFPADRAALEEGKVVESDETDQRTQNLVNCGHTYKDLKVAIVNPETRESSPPGEIGEIWVSGGSITSGYWNRPKETEEICQAVIKDTSEGPFVRTGDLGFLHQGDLFVTGRRKDMIIVRGRNYYPQDIELTVQNSHPAMQPGGGAAFSYVLDGVERLVVIHEVKREARNSIDPEEVIKSIRFGIARDQGIRAHAIVLIRPYSLPKTSSGKVMRHAAKEQFETGELSVVGDWRAPR